MWAPEIPKNVNVELPHDPAIPLLGIDPKELETDSKASTYTYVHSGTIFRIIKKGGCCSVAQSYPTLPFPSPRHLPDPEENLHLLLWQADSLPLNHQGSPQWNIN